VALGYKLFGVNEFGGRFFSGLFGFLLALLVYLLLLWTDASRRTAWFGGLAATATPFLIGAARIVTTDIFMVTFMTAAILSWIRFHRESRPVWRWLFWLMLGLSGMAKGPIGPFLAFAIILIHTGHPRRWRALRPLFQLGPTITGLVLMAWWPLFIFATVDGAFQYLVVGQIFSRMKSTGFGHPHPFWYFIELFPLAMLPWTPHLAVGMVQAWKNRTETDRLLLTWLLFPILLFSIPANKLVLYALPSVPAAVALIARAVETEAGRRLFPAWAVLAAGISLLLPTVVDLPPMASVASWRLVMVLLVGAGVTVWGRKHPAAGVLGLSGTTIAMILVAIHLVGQTPEQYFNTSRTVGARIRAIAKQRPVTLFSDGFINRGLTLYTGLHPYENEVDREVLPQEKAASRLLIPYREMPAFIRSHPDILLLRRSHDNQPLPVPMVRVFSGHRYTIYVPVPAPSGHVTP